MLLPLTRKKSTTMNTNNKVIVWETVYNVLSNHLDENNAKLALTIWEAKYQDAQISGLVPFVNDLSKEIKLSNDRQHALRMDLYKSLFDVNKQDVNKQSDTASNKPAGQNTPDTGSSTSNVSTRFLKEHAVVTPDLIVFAAIGESMIEGAQRYGYREFSNFTLAMKDNLQQANLPTLVSQSILDWCSHTAELVHSTIPKEHLRRLVNIFYVSLCEAVGPSIADAILASAIQSAEKIPEARLFSPRQFL